MARAAAALLALCAALPLAAPWSAPGAPPSLAPRARGVEDDCEPRQVGGAGAGAARAAAARDAARGSRGMPARIGGCCARAAAAASVAPPPPRRLRPPTPTPLPHACCQVHIALGSDPTRMHVAWTTAGAK
jgi:hypothetical protein